MHVWVASEGSRTIGFVALKLHAAERMSEIYMIAVDPGFQRRGTATALTNHSLAWLKQAGMTTVMVETGGDPGLESDERGIWTSPDGAQVAWFKDPDGNTLSLTQAPD